MILPEDDIAAAESITYSENLGLPKIPRANTQALAAINAITRILDEHVLKNSGAVASGEYTFEDKVDVNELVANVLTAASAIIESANISQAEVTNLRAEVLVAVNSIMTDATVENLTGQVATIASIVATAIQTETIVAEEATIQVVKATEAEIDDLTAEMSSSETSVVTTQTVTTQTVGGQKVGLQEVDEAEIHNAEMGSVIVSNELSAERFETENYIRKIYHNVFSSIEANYSQTQTLSFTPQYIDWVLNYSDLFIAQGRLCHDGNTSGYVVLSGEKADYISGGNFPSVSNELPFSLEINTNAITVNLGQAFQNEFAGAHIQVIAGRY